MTKPTFVPRRDGVLAKKPKGDVSKITLRRLQLIVGYLSNGMDQGSSARAVGIHPNTLGQWVRRGRLELVRVEDDEGIDPYEIIPTTDDGWPREGESVDTDGNKRIDHHWTEIPDGFDPIEWPFVVFSLAVEKALAAWESRMLTQIQNAASGANNAAPQWQAAAWMLERRYPTRYGRPEARLRVDAKLGVSGEHAHVEVEVVSVDDLEARFNEVASKLPDAPSDDGVVEAEIVEE